MYLIRPSPRVQLFGISLFYILFNDGNKTNLEKLYKMQKKAARIIMGSNYEIR